MRLVLLPISTKRTLLYCIRRDQATAAATSRLGVLADKATVKIASVWAGWEKRESGWQRKVVDYGNHALRRIPYQEWGLKSVPPLSSRRRSLELAGGNAVELTFPPSVIAPRRVEEVLLKLGTEREALHRSRLIWCFVGMPITIPVAILPVIPNLPFFYLVYRAWSHWRAIKGGQHIQFLSQNKLLAPSPSFILDDIYTAAKLPLAESHGASKSKLPVPNETAGTPESPGPERIIATPAIAKQLADALNHPEIEVEIERAVWQVEQSMKGPEDKGGSDSKKES